MKDLQSRFVVLLAGLLAVSVASCTPEQTEPRAGDTPLARPTTVTPAATATEESASPAPSVGTVSGPESWQSTPPGCEPAQLERVIDGDTFVATVDGRDERVRLIGIDAPELDASATEMRQLAVEAANRLTELLQGGAFCLERDVSERDRFGRLLRYVWRDDGTLVNEAMVAAGLAVVSTFPPDVKHVSSRLLPAQLAARSAGVGVWGTIPTPQSDGESPGSGSGGHQGTFSPPACYVPGANTCNCSDFVSRAHAQWFHETLDPDDVNKLDGDGDGLVCELLP